MWERRVPLCPHHVESLVKAGNKVLIQPSTKRIFSDKEYNSVGAIVTEDLKEASLIIGVKQIPQEKIYENKNYLFFSHTMKAQQANMPLLDDILAKKARLFDYENITEGGMDGSPRLVAFGKYAGIAGMIDCLQGLGQKLLADGYSNPFLNVPVAYMNQDLEKAKTAISNVGKVITETGFPKSISPLVFAFTGSGNVTKGSREIFELLPHEYVTPEELKTLEDDVRNGRRKRNVVYGVLTTAFDMVKQKNGHPLEDKADYYANPGNYVPCFHENIIPYINVLVNGFYWDARYPRLLTSKQIKTIRKQGNHNLRMVADITCDPNGSVEFMSHCTPIEKPFFSFSPERNEDSDCISADGICMLGVEILPSELPSDASKHFGDALMPLIPPLLSSKGSKTQDDISDLPPEMRRACVASHGQLMPKWQYIQRLREQASVVQKTGAFSASVVLTGHLFDSGMINKVLDHLDSSGLQYSVANLNVKQNRTSAAIPTRLELSLTGDMQSINNVTEALAGIVASVPEVKGKVTLQGALKSIADVKVKTQKRVLLLGAGMVAQPVIDVLGAMDDVHLTVASDNETQAMKMISKVKDHEFKMRFEHFTYPDGMPKISKAIQESDIIISLMPATMHIAFAKEAIKHKRHMVTASYVSPEMAALHEEAKKNGVILLNEVGLDPGIDHMLVMKAVDAIHSKGGKVTELISLCGGLPDPASADNPLLYKFSWSPKGVLIAAQNGAVHLVDGEVLAVPPGTLLQAAEASKRFPTMRLEALPNRDSVKYREIYGVPDVNTLCRGTLRYEGWSNVMNALQRLDLFDQKPMPADIQTWSQLLATKISPKSKDPAHMKSALKRYLKEKGIVDVDAAVVAVEWLGMLNDSHPMGRGSPLDELCTLLQATLYFKEGEKDMVAMYHTVLGELPDGTRERHVSRLLAFGNPSGDSAMAATVGLTTAAATELLLNGKITQTGVLIPTSADIYNPMLERLQQLGITYTESVEQFRPNDDVN